MKANHSPSFSNIPLKVPKHSSTLFIPQNPNNGTHTSKPKITTFLPEWQVEEKLLEHISNISLMNTHQAERLKRGIPDTFGNSTVSKDIIQVFL
uniref:Uncharacterized protein n=1 Tax=Cucumis melo TaxID=3656 RepID=A0A9I9E745_CUCME